jgi:IS6 family transposase
MIALGEGAEDMAVASFKGRHFTGEVILWAVRWYLMFPISYRDLELMLAERGVAVDHTTISRWIPAYAGELEKRLRPHLRTSNGSWRVDERPTSRSRRAGPTCIEQSTAAARPSTSCSPPGGMRPQRSGSSARRLASRIR